MKTFLQPLTAREEREYLRQYKEGDQEARNVLISRNMRLVAHVIKKYQNSGYETEDLLSVGTIGLIKAVDSYNMAVSYTHLAACDVPAGAGGFYLPVL